MQSFEQSFMIRFYPFLYIEQAGYCIGRDKEVVLCIQDIPVNESDTTTIEGMEVSLLHDW